MAGTLALVGAGEFLNSTRAWELVGRNVATETMRDATAELDLLFPEEEEQQE